MMMRSYVTLLKRIELQTYIGGGKMPTGTKRENFKGLKSS